MTTDLKTEEVDVNTGVKKQYIENGFLKDIGNLKIHEIIDMTKSPPTKLKITLGSSNTYNGDKKGIQKIIPGKEGSIDTYVFEDTKTRVKIADGDKIEKFS
ncbi:MAG: hypothetical protein WC872_04055 [Candidatus Absconditabacterales bacterium]